MGEYRFKIPQANIVRAFITGDLTRKTVAEQAAAFQDTITAGNRSLVINIGGWSSGGMNSLWVSDGVWIKSERMDWRPAMAFDREHRPALNMREGRNGTKYYPNTFSNLYNMASLTRILVQDGVINPAFSENGELNSRTFFGISADRDLIITAIDGWDEHHLGLPMTGWTITKCGLEGIALGAVWGGDGDAGGSFTLAIDGVVVNDWYNDGEGMRPVQACLCLEVSSLDYDQEEPPDDEEPPATDTTGFMLTVEGYKTFSGELEKE